jgi:hypothetical protein
MLTRSPVNVNSRPINSILQGTLRFSPGSKAVLVLNQHGCAVPSLEIRETER